MTGKKCQKNEKKRKGAVAEIFSTVKPLILCINFNFLLVPLALIHMPWFAETLVDSDDCCSFHQPYLSSLSISLLPASVSILFFTRKKLFWELLIETIAVLSLGVYTVHPWRYNNNAYFFSYLVKSQNNAFPKAET